MSVLLAAAELLAGTDSVGAALRLVAVLGPFLPVLAGLGMVVGGLALLRTDGCR